MYAFYQLNNLRLFCVLQRQICKFTLWGMGDKCIDEIRYPFVQFMM